MGKARQLADAVNALQTKSVTFLGTGGRIYADFSNGTTPNRTLFQTTTPDAITNVGVIPNGVGTSARLTVFGNSDPTNASSLNISQITNTESRIVAGRQGTGVYCPLTAYVNNAEAWCTDLSGNFGLGGVPLPASTGYLSLNLGPDSYMLADKTSAPNTSFNLSQNAAFTAGAWTYIQTYKASCYVQNDGAHVFRYAVSGTAATAITWLEAGRFTNAGHFGVGTASPVSFGGGYRTAHVKGSTTTDGGVFRTSTSDDSIAADFFTGSSFAGAVIRTATNHVITFQTNSLSVLRLNKVTNAVNGVDITPAATGNGPIITAFGSDTNIDLNLTPKGTGGINANANLTATGYARSAGVRVYEGVNAKMGTATLVAGTATVSNTSVTANSRIFLTSQADGGMPGAVRVSSRVAGTSFTITSSSGSDTSTVAWMIVEPG